MKKVIDALNQANELSALVRELTGGIGRHGLVHPAPVQDVYFYTDALRKAVDAFDQSIMDMGDVGLE